MFHTIEAVFVVVIVLVGYLLAIRYIFKEGDMNYLKSRVALGISNLVLLMAMLSPNLVTDRIGTFIIMIQAMLLKGALYDLWNYYSPLPLNNGSKK